jgi:3-methylcrotonyl-CoA carboxylase alpha subunit
MRAAGAMFARILIANRGEIACRVIRTARRLGIATVAVYSDADRDALHVRSADEAVRIGPAPARDSYLRGDVIIAAARATGAEAIHPGYGFLSENAEFAEACAAAGIVFIGPLPHSIRAMGGKSAAKALMEKAGVPVVPGYHGADQTIGVFAEHARRIGYPILVKASAGGGGKGMRIVERESDLAEAIAAARREAAAAFGDDRVLIEKYLLRPRHIEVQVFGDSHGDVVHLCERDCSLQRRHQKVVEEAPAPGITPERRAALGAAAVRAARAVDYAGAGTIEFIADADGSFYFMEMNTRLQVEHPVTEMITGLDLVELQLRIAAGERLGLEQSAITPHGHAIEVRLYAEDPRRDFLPATGHLARLRFPEATRHVRVDAGVATGDTITVHYDPMIAKLIVWDTSRDAALRRLGAALADTEIAGLVTNLDFLRRVSADADFASGAIDTGFIARHRASLMPAPAPASTVVLAFAALAVRAARRARRDAQGDPANRRSPWDEDHGWRLNEPARDAWIFDDAGQQRRVALVSQPGSAELLLEAGDRRAVLLRLPDAQGRMRVAIDGHVVGGAVAVVGDEIFIDAAGTLGRLTLRDPLAGEAVAEEAAGRLASPMPGKVVAVKVREGDRVRRGEVLLVLEAMKMEHSIVAPVDGIVERLRFAAGDQVDEGVDLVGLRAADKPAASDPG